MYSLEYNHIQHQINSINENMKESNQKNIKYVLIEIDDKSEEILNSIPDDKIIDTCIMSEEMVNRIGCPVIYKP